MGDLYVGERYAVKGYAGPATLVAVEDTGRVAPNGAPVRIASVRFGADSFRPCEEFAASRLSAYEPIVVAPIDFATDSDERLVAVLDAKRRASR